MDNEIKHKEDDNKGMFYIEDEGGIVAEVTYTIQDDGVLVIDETETDPKMEGKGLASKLIKRVVEYAREKKYLVEPLCAFAAAQFKRHEEYREIQVE